METRQGDGTEALSQETESNGSATPKSRRHPLTLPADSGSAARKPARFARNGATIEKESRRSRRCLRAIPLGGTTLHSWKVAAADQNEEVTHGIDADA